MKSIMPGSPLCFQSYQNHSEEKLGTEKTPQCMKIPSFASSYQSGRGRESRDFQFGSYRTVSDTSVNRWTTKMILKILQNFGMTKWKVSHVREIVTWFCLRKSHGRAVHIDVESRNFPSVQSDIKAVQAGTVNKVMKLPMFQWKTGECLFQQRTHYFS